MTRQINQAGLDIIKSCEGCELRAYVDAAGIWTIGYGHTPSFEGQTITQAEADALLVEDLARIEDGVMNLLDGCLATDNEFSALVSLAYNIGLGALGRSTLLRYHKEGKRPFAANQFLVWNKVRGKVMQALAKRRVRERLLYLAP